VVRIPDAKVALSTASVYPESTATAFEIAARLGYDGVEVMVWTDPVSQDIEALRRLSDYHRVPILAVHAPCLLITQRVWSTDPWVKLQRAQAAAEKLGASTVVVHPPFRWQRQYARDFIDGIWRMANETDVRFAVENMYPWRYRDREMLAYAPEWDVSQDDYRHYTIDLSHTATARSDAMEMVARMGDRLGHVHLADGRGSAKDEHLVPGRGTQPCAELLEHLAGSGFDGHVVIEVNTARPTWRRRWPSPGCTSPPRPASDDPAGSVAVTGPRRGRGRPSRAEAAAGPGTRERILEAARAEFAERGYDKTSVRGIAKAAGVDPALVHHYFGTKDEVFAAAIELSFEPALIIPAIVGESAEGIGERLARYFLSVWENPVTRAPLLAVIRSALTHEAAAKVLRGFVLRRLLQRVAADLDVPDPEFRAELAASHMIGIAILRYVVQVEPLASARPEDIVAMVAPTLQRYLTED
jgi:sugar phosphate isomerase/epimerase/AcrR family transcriptional regulator